MKSPVKIAIDGPVASGKGEIASRLSKELGFVNIYTGGMYRALALACIQAHISTKDAERVSKLLDTIQIRLVPTDISGSFACRVYLNDKDITERILEPDVAVGSSDVAVIKDVREKMVKLQKALAQKTSVVMEGRDIGLRVLPDAQLKIYLTASLEERAKRRFLQWRQKGIEKTIEDTIQEVKDRDYQDMHRETDPLTKLPDSWELDTTHLTPDTVVKKIIDELKKRKLL